MNTGAQAELDCICAELDKIITELEDISWGLRADFQGVGTEKCADCLDNALSQYCDIRRRLLNMNIADIRPRVIGRGGGSK